MVGHRRLFLYDTSIVFDGMWRVMQGQRLYADVLVAQRPLAYYLGALWMSLFGVTLSSFIALAAAVNVAGTLLADRIARILAPGTEWIAAFTTVIWLIPITGFLQIEQGAFLFNWVALWLLHEARTATQP
jgi:hypothetical protein